LLNSSCGQEVFKESRKKARFILKAKINNTYLLVGPLWAPHTGAFVRPTHGDGASGFRSSLLAMVGH